MTECFTIYANEFEGRIDPHFYRPEFLELEKKIAKKTNKKLGDFIISVSGGATPSRQKDDELYTDEEQGIPFLRVQNITENGLVLDDVKFITKEVHETELKRSQIKEDNLLITITGRIASSCVVPKGFEGNINQHSVVIETKDRKTAEIIATFLNSSIGQKLALRRTSGGSRLALDYKALKSIPIILNEKIVSLMDNAYKEQKNKEEKTAEFLDSINDYVLDELGIKLPELKDKMIYLVDSDAVQNKRADAYYYQPKFEEIEKAVKKGKFEVKELNDIADELLSGQRPKGGVRQINEGIPSLGGEHVLSDGKIATTNLKFIPKEFHKKQLKSKVQKRDIIIVKDGATTGKVGIIPENYPFEEANINEHVFLLRVKKEINPYYIFSIIKSELGQVQINREITGGTIMGIIRETTESLKIPLPPLSIQNKIAEEVKKRMQKAEQLQKEAKEELEKAKQEVERIILG